MDFLTTTLLSGVIYDMTKHKIAVTADNLKAKLRNWLLDEEKSIQLEQHLSQLQINEDLSESAIEKRLLNSPILVSLLREVKPANTVNISQTHQGTGDNVGGNKIIQR